MRNENRLRQLAIGEKMLLAPTSIANHELTIYKDVAGHFVETQKVVQYWQEWRQIHVLKRVGTRIALVNLEPNAPMIKGASEEEEKQCDTVFRSHLAR